MEELFIFSTFLCVDLIYQSALNNFIVFQLSCYCKCSVALPQDDMGWSAVCDSVIHLQFWAYGSSDSLLPISLGPTANLRVQIIIFHDKSAIPLHSRTR